MVPEAIAITCTVAAAAFAAGWLNTSVRLAKCRREQEESSNSFRVTEFEKRLLELVARGASLHQLLDHVTLAIEAMAPECLCTVMLLDEEERRFLFSASGPSVSAEYLQALNGLEIGPDVGACGSAAFRNETVIVEDIATDYRFALAKDLVLSFGLRSCWSVPIRNFNGAVQGTFAMYHRKPSKPRQTELQLVEAGSRLNGNVIERLRSEQRLREAAERLELAEKAAEFGIWEVRIPGGAVAVSEGFATLVGLPAASGRLNLHELDRMLHPDDRDVVRAAAEAAIETGTFQAEFRIVLPDGSVRWERSQGRVERLEEGARRAVGALIDITEERDLLTRLEEARTAAEGSARVARQAERLELDRKNILEMLAKDALLGEIALAMAMAVERQIPFSLCSIQLESPAQRISVSPHVPERLAQVLGRISIASVREASSVTPIAGLSRDPEWQQCVESSTGLHEQNYVAASILQNRLVAGVFIILLPGDKLAPTADRELLESWARFAGFAIERRALYEQLSFRARYDELTSLLNRASLYDRMEALMSSGIHKDGAMAVLYFDLDFFKEINDHYGHAAGDMVLRIVSQRILQSTRRADVAARIGGDEFVILLPGVCDRRDARHIAELIGQAINEPIESDGWKLRVATSIGIAVYPNDGRHIDDLLKTADEDMYRAKLNRQSDTRRRINQKRLCLDPETATVIAFPSLPVVDRDDAGPDA
jgi:diguanylate cyclase (GGDEF)-like protein/PAS domain S-box-containing protein